MMGRKLWLLLIARIFLGTVFAYAGFSKLMEPYENFRGALAEYRVIPYGVVGAVAAILPWLELIFGVFLILGYAVRLSALVSTFLAGGFLVVLGASQLFYGSIPASCGCFGEQGIHLTVSQVMSLDFLDFLIGLKLVSTRQHAFSLDAWFRKTSIA